MTNATENMCTQEHQATEFDETEAQTQVEEAISGLAPTELEQALDQLRPILLGIPADEVRRLRTNPTYAVAVCMRVAVAFERDRARFASGFMPELFDVTRYDDLTQRALALWQADIRFHRVKGGEGAAAAALERAKYSKLGIADDLAALVDLFREQWEFAEPNCRITEQDLEEAAELSQQVIRSSTTTARSEEVEEVLDLRNRAAEHLRRGVDDVRAAASFVFRDDPESLASYPSLFAQRRKRNGGSASHQVEPEALPAEPEAMPVEPPASPEPVDLPPLEF
jgi:hypothetical protein